MMKRAYGAAPPSERAHNAAEEAFFDLPDNSFRIELLALTEAADRTNGRAPIGETTNARAIHWLAARGLKPGVAPAAREENRYA